MERTIAKASKGYPKIEDYLEKVQHRLKPKRFQHTLGVVEMAATLARAHGANVEKAMTAAALHDYVKNHSGEELILLAQEFQLELDLILVSDSELLHGVVGAELLRRELGLEDEDVLNAIRFHTYGRTGMSVLEKVVYLADAIEPGRDYDGVKELRQLALKDLDAAMFVSVKQTIQYVMNRGFLLHPNSVLLYNELVEQLQ